MKEYPSIPAAADLLARPDAYLGQPFVAFDKLDGSNIRAEWDRKKGWLRFGSRRRLLERGRRAKYFLPGGREHHRQRTAAELYCRRSRNA